ncbi:MAG TPA: ABC transporter permease [Acidimicrobiales bacterium]|nr:ABC transporter permease [Acidimicrobiales bacterium]
MNQFFTYAILTATVASAIQYTTPFLLAALGETIGQRSGVLNLGVDGIMLLGAFGCYYVALETGSDLLGILVGVGIGAVLGLVTAFMSVTLKAQQGISGIGVYIFGLGLSDLLFVRFVGTPVPVSPLPNLNIPLLSHIPAVGRMFFQQNLLVYLAFLFVPATAFILYHTTYGTRVLAVGENPAAADSLGISVPRIRYSTVLFGCMMASLAGATLLLLDGIFQEDLTQSAGFIAVALVYFGAWRPVGVMTGSLLYGIVTAVVLQWKSLGIIPTSAADLAATAPAIVTVLALVALAGRFRQPAALAKPYVRGA